MSELFGPAGPADDFHRNAMLWPREDDGLLGEGFIAAGNALVRHWQEHGPNDLMLMPMILTYRHGLELLLKEAIREAAGCLRRDGLSDPTLASDAIDSWLKNKAGHRLRVLGVRLDELLDLLREETLPSELHTTLNTLHELDPSGETFRYAASWDRERKRFIPSARPHATHIDVVAMGEEFGKVASLIGGGVLTVLDLYREAQAEYGP
jgi:hypothetical protein